jgi:hypothetical protein
LAMELDAPLNEIRKSGTAEQNQRIRGVFETEKVPTPWLRSEEEYQQFFRVKQEMMQQQ